MTFNRLFTYGAALFLFGALAQASSISLTATGVEVPDGPGLTSTHHENFPALLGGNADIGLPNFQGDTIFLKFFPGDLSNIAVINSFSFSVDFIDDEVDGGESVEVAFAQPSSNILFTPTFTKLGAPVTNAPVPVTLTFTLTASQIAQVLPSITNDGNFRIRVERLTGDFNVTGGSALLDVTYAPEPSTALLLLTTGVCVIAGRRRLR